MTDVTNRTAFITGGANGIGLGIARALAKAGVKVALADRDEAALGRAKSELSAVTAVETVVLDVRDRETFARAGDTVEGRLGPVSLLFNNAGVAGGASPAKMTYELWDWGLGINLTGVVNGTQTFLPRMIARQQGGHIVNTASGAGLAAAGSGTLYTTAKFAVVGMSESLAIELKQYGIGVTVLCPGPVATDIIARTRSLQPGIDKALTDTQRAEATERMARMSKWLQKGVPPDAVGDMVLDAVREERLYIHTDRTMAQMIEARCKALLEAMPAV
ncbi:MAG TPA: SDR family oxidoreductase [Rhizomicrobium sp.]|jgi:NAD(P)-dependent dehydrogenase (short-subunit alcohol dehydrogenase family)